MFPKIFFNAFHYLVMFQYCVSSVDKGDNKKLVKYPITVLLCKFFFSFFFLFLQLCIITEIENDTLTMGELKGNVNQVLNWEPSAWDGSTPSM